MNIINYKPAYKHHFGQLNRAWLQKYFYVEELDEYILTQPEEAILKDGGCILFVENEGMIIGTVALIFIEPGIYELAKMAVDKRFQGLGAGKLLCEAAIEKAKGLQATELILYSNKKLPTAIIIYRKYGFVEIPMEEALYKRADIKMRLCFDQG